MALFGSFKDVYDKVFTTEAVNIDNIVFKLHYRVTVTALVIFSVVLSLGQYAGDPIDCFYKGNFPENFVDNVCWVDGTYTEKYREGDEKQGQAGKLNHLCDGSKKDHDCWHHQYYQWVALFIIFQAGFFYLPKYLWSNWENGKIKSLVDGLERSNLIQGTHERKFAKDSDHGQKLRKVVETFEDTKGQHNLWAWKYYACEFLTLANLILQFVITDIFLQGHFRAVALDGLDTDEHVSVLPITGSCHLSTFGLAGGENAHNPICVLPLNMINQKYFSFLYVWMGLLVVLTLGIITFRVLMVILPDFRTIVLKSFYGIKVKKTNRFHNSDHGDWLLLSYMIGNMNPLVASQFIDHMDDKYENDIE